LLAFIHIHKTGGTTLQWILRSSLGASYCEIEPLRIGDAYRDAPWMAPASADDLAYITKLYPRLQGIGGHHVQPHTDLHIRFPHLRYFTFMRDPVKMRASMYQHGVETLGEENCRFDDWRREAQSQNRQTKMLAGTADVDKAIKIIHKHNIFVGLTDVFSESLLMLRAHVAPELNIFYRRMNVASGDTAAKRLLASPTGPARLREGNEADIALYRYVKEELLPQYREEYGREALDADKVRYEAELAQYQQRKVSLSFMSRPRLLRLLLLLKPEPFQRRNVAAAMFKKHLLYRPKMRLHRRRLPH
jgi:hypothetical protein